jgi:hypothetical protein
MQDTASFAGPLSFVTPGGGLKQLDLLPQETEYVFENTFATPGVVESVYSGSDGAGLNGDFNPPKLVPVRIYSDNKAM